MEIVEKDGEALVREAFTWAADTGGDKPGRTPQEEIRKEWQSYIEDVIDDYYERHDGLPDEECARMREAMLAHADDVAEDFGVLKLPRNEDQ